MIVPTAVIFLVVNEEMGELGGGGFETGERLLDGEAGGRRNGGQLKEVE